jgi:MFS family permease
LLLAAAFNKWMLFGGRIISGLGTGITTIAVPVYVSEVASPNVRGMLGSFFQVPPHLDESHLVERLKVNFSPPLA